MKACYVPLFPFRAEKFLSGWSRSGQTEACGKSAFMASGIFNSSSEISTFSVRQIILLTAWHKQNAYEPDEIGSIPSPILYSVFQSNGEGPESFCYRFSANLVAAKPWIIMALVAGLTAVMVYFVDTMAAVLFDYKYGFCKSMFPGCTRALRQRY